VNLGVSMDKMKIALTGLLVIAFSSGIALSSLILTTQVQTTITLQNTYVETLAQDGVTKITTLTYGTLYPEQSDYRTIYIKNLTEEIIKATWNCTGLPDGLSITMKKYSNGQWSDVLQNTDVMTLNVSESLKLMVTAKFSNGSGGLKSFKININSYL
jgi:hypothetical protein